MPITPLPTPPNYLAPLTFPSLATNWVGQFTTQTVHEINAALASFGPGNPYCAVGGSANARTLTSGLNLTSLVTGQQVRFRANVTNSASTTINLDGLGVKTAKTPTGANLPAGYLRTDVDTEATYDGTNWIVYRRVESGSNGSGSWTRYEDGSQVCWVDELALPDSTTASGSIFRSGTGTWTFPAGFVDSNVAVTITGTTLQAWASGGTTSASGATVRAFSYISATGITAGAQALGRWY